VSDLTCAVLVIGAGPGGYVAAIRAAQLGLDTIIVDSGPAGGTCLNVGCIPSKALIHAADEYASVAGGDELARLGIQVSAATVDLAATTAWKDTVVQRLRGGVEGLLEGAGVRRVTGRATIVDGKTISVGSSEGDVTVRTSNLVIASGSRPIELAHLPFGGSVISSTEALAVTELPSGLVIVGAGYIGLELGIAFRKLGSNVTVVEMLDRILPQYDQMLTRPLMKRLGQLGIPVLLETVATRMTASGDALVVTDAGGVEAELPADKVLVTVGRTTAVGGWGLEALDLDMDGSRIRVDDRCHTSMRGVYAIGDVTGEPMLAHRAMAQGEMVAEIIAGLRRSWDKRAIPEVCFTDPEIVSVGLSPDQAATDGIDCVVDSFPFAANARALTLDRTDGFVRIVARRDDHLVLGVQAVGPGVAELSSEFCLALEMGATLEDLAATVHAHPTLGEAVPEAALKALGRGLHSRS